MSGNIGSPQKIYVWLDGKQSESLDCTAIRREVEKINGQFQFCDNESNCEAYLRGQSASDRVVLIVSGTLGTNLVPKIHDLPQIIDIFVYCGKKTAHSQWTKNFAKVKGISSDFPDLHQKLSILKVLPTATTNE